EPVLRRHRGLRAAFGHQGSAQALRQARKRARPGSVRAQRRSRAVDERSLNSMGHADLELQERPLDNTPVTTGLYIAHVAVPCRDLEEAARWYAEVLGAQPVRKLKDRVTFSFGGVLQLVCHLERRAIVHNPRAYPRHHGLTFLVRPTLRFANTAHEHQTFMVSDPTGNVVEFKCYVRPENSY